MYTKVKGLMFKCFLLLILSISNSIAMSIAHGEINEISKSDAQFIIKEAENIGIPNSLEINKIRSWREGSYDKKHFEYVVIDFKPHKEGVFYEIFYTLYCNTSINNQWVCRKDDNIRIRFDLKELGVR